MNDDWNRFVRVTRSDGSERTLPLAAWTEDLAKRVLESGGSFVLPQEAENRFAPFPDEETREEKPQPKARTRREADLETIDILLGLLDVLTPWECEFTESLSNWLKNHDTLSTKQRDKAFQTVNEN